MLAIALAATVGNLAAAQDERSTTFTDVAATVGIDFEHFLGSTGDFLFPEVTAAGAAFLDYDNDGDLDVYLLQGCLLDPEKKADDLIFSSPVALPARNRLYRNELSAKGELKFTDVTETSGAGDTGYAQGVATADYDNDGDVDVLVTRRRRRTSCSCVTTATRRSPEVGGRGRRRRRRVGGRAPSFFDYDRDGFLDLYVAAYADYSVATDKDCLTATGGSDYCGPSAYPPAPGRLYRNKGDGTFEDVSAAKGIDREYGHCLGVSAADFDGNGWTDIYVANDGDANQLWMNDEGSFKNAGLLSGAAVNGSGKTEAGMGVAVDDFDEDGDLDIFLTHLSGETNTLYENLGQGFFADRTARFRLGLPSRPGTGFGVAWADVDHDADLDLFVLNGAVLAVNSLDGPFPYHQPNKLMVRTAKGSFVDASASAGAPLALSEVSRGLACGDIDNDGDVDFLINNANGPARLLRNELAEKENWLSLRVLDQELGRDAVGALVRVKLEDGRVLNRRVVSDGSYCSAVDPRVHFAWPAKVALKSVEIVPLGGEPQAFEALEPMTFTTLVVEGGSARKSDDER